MFAGLTHQAIARMPADTVFAEIARFANGIHRQSVNGEFAIGCDSTCYSLCLQLTDNACDQQVKAQIVAALKAMTSNLQYGAQVAHLLNANPIWAEYRDQKHDLFITDSNVRGYLTGRFADCVGMRVRIDISHHHFWFDITGNPTAGYLTQGPSKNIEVLTSPPPIDRDDPLSRTPID